jgi:hypothetical protein
MLIDLTDDKPVLISERLGEKDLYIFLLWGVWRVKIGEGDAHFGYAQQVADSSESGAKVRLANYLLKEDLGLSEVNPQALIDLLSSITNGPEPAPLVPEGILKFGGVYRFKNDYLRFYPDRTVLNVSTSGEPDQIASWFGKDHDYLSIGTYTLSGNQLKFSATCEYGDVDFEGSVQGDTLVLNIHSRINNHRERGTYKFNPVTFGSP